MLKISNALQAMVVASSLATPALAGPMALTWVVNSREVVMVNGVGDDTVDPRWVLVGGDAGYPNARSNPYDGDTLKTDAHRMLCFVPGTTPNAPSTTDVGNTYRIGFYDYLFGAPASNGHPAIRAATSMSNFYMNWSGGSVGLTQAKYTHVDIPSPNVGNQICQQDLNNTNARMLEFHDNGVGGWYVGAAVLPGTPLPAKFRKTVNFWRTAQVENDRFWVWNNDTQVAIFNP